MVAPKKIEFGIRGNYDVLNKVIYLDAGHGGYDPGGLRTLVFLKELDLGYQSRVKAKLEAEGYQVMTTRTSDTYVDLTDRSRAANASESDIFVSIHNQCFRQFSSTGNRNLLLPTLCRIPITY
ncbi:MAG: N-acetylmuramoyl-L-alanine amidase family protein [Streptococcus salivarius]